MSLIIKCPPFRPDNAGRRLLLAAPYGELTLQVGDEVFVWTSETKGGVGLFRRGVLHAFGDGAPLPLEVALETSPPNRALSKADLARALDDGGPLASLAGKLYRHSLDNGRHARR